MKYLIIVILTILSISFTNAQSKVETIEFRVEGNCSMCKERIEESLEVKGVKKAEWNQETKMVKVIYKPSVISLEKLHQLPADAGHDTEKVKAKDQVYKKLEGCCHYREDLPEDTKHH